MQARVFTADVSIVGSHLNFVLGFIISLSREANALKMTLMKCYSLKEQEIRVLRDKIFYV